jgi:Mannosyl-glycoprotein endo-beta-N-acetylglucosaminidase
MVDGTLSQASLDVIAAAQSSYKKFWPRGPFVSVSLAQYAVESAWGSRVSGKNNFFGIKANAAQVAAGQFTERWTKEQLQSGQIISIVQKFANYDSLQDAFDAHATLLTHTRYIDCMNAKTPEDYCRALQKDGYATAQNYAAVLIAMINENGLKKYDQIAPSPGASNAAPAGPPASAAGGGGGPDPAADATKEPPMANTTQPVVPAAPATPATPVVAPPVVVDWGDFADQLISTLEPAAANAINAGVDLAAGEIPGGSLLLDFIGQNMVSQFVASGATSIEALLKGKSLSVSPTNALETMVLQTINTELPGVAAFFSASLPAWISAEVAKIQGALAAKASAPAAAPVAPAAAAPAAPGTAKT